MNSTAPLCPREGYFAASWDACSAKFIKCQRSQFRDYMIEGYMYQCPEGFAYWPISQRCERLNRLEQCQNMIKSDDSRWEIPIDLINVSYRRRKSASHNKLLA